MITAILYQDCVHSAAADRRRFQRLRVALQAELRIEGDPTPIRVTTADISLGGCYIEMPITLAVGTSLCIVLWLDHKKLETKGKVVTCHSQFGNGIEFLGMSAHDRQRLDGFLDIEAADAESEHSDTTSKGFLV